jgi:hypothetical protein
MALLNHVSRPQPGRKLAAIAGLVLVACLALTGIGEAATQSVEKASGCSGHELRGSRRAPQCNPKVPTGPQVRTSTTLATTEVAGATAQEVDQIDLKVLVLSADGNEANLPAIKQVLDYLGTPYEVYIAAQTPGGLTADKLYQGVHAYYQAVILTTGELVYYNGSTYVSALNQTEWQKLWNFEALFGIRQVCWYVFPTPALGFNGTFEARDTSTSPVTARWTLAGKSAFPYVNGEGTLKIQNAYTYLSGAATDGLSQTLLEDDAGHALALIRSFPDGRQVLSCTFDSNQYLRHNLVLAYGLVRWACKGLFLGERHAYMAAQVDDVFLATAMYPAGSGDYRITGADGQAVKNWQNAVRNRPTMAQFAIDMAFNGAGSQPGYTDPEPDTLTPFLMANQADFKWISHTDTHADLDAVTALFARGEQTRNTTRARDLGLLTYDRRSIVNPRYTGLNNPNAMKGLYDAGVRFCVADSSYPQYANPSPNVGIPNPHQPGILMIPRRATNLYFNVSTPAEWTGEYNQIYRSFWGRDLTYQEILDQESELMLGYLLRGETAPLMFHQANLRAYDGVRSLMGDLIDRTLDKYEPLVKTPVLSPTMDKLADLHLKRKAYNDGGVTAQIVPPMNGQPGSITIRATSACTVPVTGLTVPRTTTTSTEVYAGDNISYIKLTAGQSVTYPLN